MCRILKVNVLDAGIYFSCEEMKLRPKDRRVSIKICRKKAKTKQNKTKKNTRENT